MILAGDDCGGPASARRVTEARSFLAVLFVATMRRAPFVRSEGIFDEDSRGLRDFL